MHRLSAFRHSKRSIPEFFHAVWVWLVCRRCIGYLMVTLNIIPAWHFAQVSLCLHPDPLYYKRCIGPTARSQCKEIYFTLFKVCLYFPDLFHIHACEMPCTTGVGFISTGITWLKAIATIAFVFIWLP